MKKWQKKIAALTLSARKDRDRLPWNFWCQKSLRGLARVRGNLTIGVLVFVMVMLILGPNVWLAPEYVAGAYTTTSVDADGNTHLADNNATDTYLYDTSKDSDAATQAKLGVDPNWKNGVVRESSALEFDGSNDMVDIGNFNTTLNQATFESWIKFSGQNSYQVIIQKNGGFGLDINNANDARSIQTNIGDGAGNWGTTYYSATKIISTDDWHHIAESINGKEIRVFLDGKLIIKNTSSSYMATNNNHMCFGNYCNGQPLQGSMDETRISNVVRYNGSVVGTKYFEPARRFVEDVNTVGLWHFDEGSGAVAKDSSQYGNNGTLMNGSSNSPAANGTTNGPIWRTGAGAIMDGFTGDNPDAGTTNITGDPGTASTSGTSSYISQPPTQNKINGQTGAGNLAISSNSATTNDKAYEVKTTGSGGLYFDAAGGGLGDYVTGTGSGMTNVGSRASVTVESWVYLTQYPAGANGHIFNKGLSGNCFNYGIQLDTNGRLIATNNSNSTTISDPLPLNAWTHIAVVYNSNGAKGYINGLYSGSGTNNYTSICSDNHWTIGARAYNSVMEYFKGTMDEVRVSSTQRYTANFTPARRFTTDSATIGLWHFDESTGTTLTDYSGNNNTGTLMNGSSNSPAANGTTNGPIWSEGIYTTKSNIGTGNEATTFNWAMPGYQFREPLKVTNTTSTSSILPGYTLTYNKDRATLLNNNQTRSDGNDFRVMYQPSDTKRSLSFDGSNDYVNVPDSTSLNMGTGSFSVGAWVKPSGAGVYRVINKMDASLKGWLLDINHDGNNANPNYIRFRINDGTTSISYGASALVGIGSWRYVSMTVDKTNNQIKLYLDGIQVGTTQNIASITGSISNIAGVGIANIPVVAGSFFSGLVDDARIYNKALSASEIKALYNGGQGNNGAVSSGLVGWWKLDEGSGQQIIDYSGLGNNGTLGASSSSASDDPTWLSGTTADGVTTTAQEVSRFIPHGNALSFNGTSDYLDVANESNFDFANTSFTVEGWMKTVSTTTDYLVAKMQANISTGYMIGINNAVPGKLSICLKNNSANCTLNRYSNATVNDGKWHHFAVQITTNTTNAISNNANIYIDGKLSQGNITRTSDGLYAPNDTTLKIGKRDSGNYFTGQLDEVRISSGERFSNNFTPTRNPLVRDQNTVGLWHFDESSGTTAGDSSGVNTATLNTPTWVINGGYTDSTTQVSFQTVAPIGTSVTDGNYYLYYGKTNEQGSPLSSYNRYGLKMDGTDDYVNVGTQSAFNFSGTANFTFSAWVKIVAHKDRNTILSRMNVGVAGQYMFQTNSAGKVIFQREVSPYTLTSNAALSIGVWKLATASYDGTNMRIYIDGVLDNTMASGSIPNNVTLLTIGMQQNNNASVNFFNGSLDDVRIYNRALSATEISALYSNVPSVSNTGLVGQWKFDDSSPAGNIAVDSSGNGNNGTLTNFNHNQNSGWIVNNNALALATEPTVTASLATPETESPIFYTWRQAGGSWSTRTQITATETQLGSEGVYLRWNPEGAYSKEDYYMINSWAVEAFSKGTGGGIDVARGKRRSFPDKANLVVSSAGLDIIDAVTNKLWMRLPTGSSKIITSAPLRVRALNGQIYFSSNNGYLNNIQMDLDKAQRFSTAGLGNYQSNIAHRNDGVSNYIAGSGMAIVGGSYDISATVITTNGTPKQYLATSTVDGISLIQNITQLNTISTSQAGSLIVNYAKTANDNYNRVFLTSNGSIYGANWGASGSAGVSLDRWDNVQSDWSDKIGVTNPNCPKAVYTTAGVTAYSASCATTTTIYPNLKSNNVNDIAVSVGTSTADYASNTVAVASDGGTSVIQEHTTAGSGTVQHYVGTGDVGSSGWNSKEFGQAMEFDGVNDYINVPTSTSTNLGMSSFTTEAWVYPTTTNQMRVVNKFSTVPYTGWSLDINTTLGGSNAPGYIRFRISDGVNDLEFSENANISINKWYQITVTVDRTNNIVNFFVNGIKLGSNKNIATITGSVNSASNIGIGTDIATYINWFNGKIDEIRISNSVRYSCNSISSQCFTPSVKAFVSDANTTALYHFNERTGQVVADDSGNGNNGTLGANATIASDDPTRISPALGGTSGKAVAVGLSSNGDMGENLIFDGGNDYVSTNANAPVAKFDRTDKFSFGGWFKAPATGTNAFMGTGNGGGYYLLQSSSNVSILLRNTWITNCIYITYSGFFNNTWRHLYFTYDGSSNASGVNMYFDGIKQIGSVTYNSLSASIKDGTSFDLGKVHSSSNNFYSGSMSDVRVYSKQLTASEVSGLYNGGQGTTTNSISNLTAWWKLNNGSGQTVTDSSTNLSAGTLGATSASSNDDPVWGYGSPVKENTTLWVGTNGAEADDGAITAISRATGRQITVYTASNSILPDNDINSLSLGNSNLPGTAQNSGLALVGTENGAWNTGKAGFIVDDTTPQPNSVPVTNPTTNSNVIRLQPNAGQKVRLAPARGQIIRLR